MAWQSDRHTIQPLRGHMQAQRVQSAVDVGRRLPRHAVRRCVAIRSHLS